ncbi:ABC-2 transporter permease [[Clostridium] fimetarium]|uniref:ABC-2 family transporter protein n=1 Tax=[Clostridium] fimetarium TaxID=99656 RepID=A0A1I0RK84_9FIRM|nr:ABC-2 transporter permease [[Clostridium] fimetarium]SEW41435.1 ABC-2 family transporter protein [[Clostridium] fimetarium]
MLGLMIKDVYTIKRQFKIVVLMSIFYIGFSILDNNIGFLSFVALFANIGLILPIFSYDEKGQWDKYARILPVSYEKMVLSRYVEVLIVNGVMLAILIPISLFVKKPEEEFLEILSILVAVISIGVLLISIMFPIIYKKGIEKARIMIFVVILVPTCLIATLAKWNINIDLHQILVSPVVGFISYHLYIICPLIAAVSLALSYQISKSIVAKKEY